MPLDNTDHARHSNTIPEDSAKDIKGKLDDLRKSLPPECFKQLGGAVVNILKGNPTTKILLDVKMALEVTKSHLENKPGYDEFISQYKGKGESYKPLVEAMEHVQKENKSDFKNDYKNIGTEYTNKIEAKKVEEPQPKTNIGPGHGK